MKQTLLEIVQTIAASMDSEEVSSINDTVESNQIALIVKGVYFDMLSDIALPERNTLVQLNASQSLEKPCCMTIPSNCLKIHTISYDVRTVDETTPNYQNIQYMCFEDFINMQQGLREETTNVGTQSIVMNGETFNIMYRSDKAPTYYTHVDDKTLIFDSYNIEVDDTLKKSKTMCVGSVQPTFEMSDTFIPEIDPTQFAYLVNRSKVRAFNELKQQTNAEAGGEARRQKIIIQKRKRKTPDSPSEVYRVNSRFGRK